MVIKSGTSCPPFAVMTTTGTQFYEVFMGDVRMVDYKTSTIERYGGINWRDRPQLVEKLKELGIIHED